MLNDDQKKRIEDIVINGLPLIENTASYMNDNEPASINYDIWFDRIKDMLDGIQRLAELQGNPDSIPAIATEASGVYHEILAFIKAIGDPYDDLSGE